MAVSRSRLSETFAEDMRQRIDTLKAVDNINDHLNGRKLMDREMIKVCEIALKHSLPALKQIEGGALVDNSVTIQVIKFGDDNHTSGSQGAGSEALLHRDTLPEGASNGSLRIEQKMRRVHEDIGD